MRVLLPRWRGAAPIARAIEAGDAETGVTLMKMELGLDTGPMVAEARTPILAEDTTATLTGRLASMGANLLVQSLQHANELICTPQPDKGVLYAEKLLKSEKRIQWNDSAAVIARRLRAFTPFPGLEFHRGADVVKVWSATAEDADTGLIGEVLSIEHDLVVRCGVGALRITELQRPGKTRSSAQAAVQGLHLQKVRCFNDGSGPNKHTTDKAANRLQLPLQQLIELAADVRRRMLEGASLSSALETVSIGLSAQARAALQSIVYDAIRRRAFSNAAAAGLLSSPPPPPVMGLLEIAIALVVEGRYSDFTLVNETVNAARNNRRTVRFAGLINAVLRRFLREREQISAVLQKTWMFASNAPLWWIRRIKESHPSNWEEILRIGTLRAPMTLRVNARRITPAAYLEELKARGIPALRVGRSAVMLESPLPVKDIPGFTEGIVSVQDAGTQLAAEILAPQK